MSASRWRGWVAAIALFGAGVALGGASATWLGLRHLRQALQAPADAPGYADRAATRIGQQLTKELELTPDESTRVQEILARSAANLKAVRRQAADNARTELRASTREIAASLPKEKRAEFLRLIARRYLRLGLSTTENEIEPAR